MSRRLRAVKAVALAIGLLILMVALVEVFQWRRAPDHVALRRLRTDIVAALRDDAAGSFDLHDYAPAAATHACIFSEYTDIQLRLAFLLPQEAPSPAHLSSTRENETALVFVGAGRADAIFLDIPGSAFIDIARSCLPVAVARLEVAPSQGRSATSRLRFRAVTPQ